MSDAPLDPDGPSATSRAASTGGVDWRAAEERLARLADALHGRRRDEAELLRRRAARLAARPADAPAGNERPYLAFRRGEDRIAIAMEALREAVRPRSVLPLPGVPPHIRGVVLNRGEVVPVVEAGWFLDPDLVQAEAPALLLVVEAGGTRFALAADLLDEVRSLDPSAGGAAMHASGRLPPFVVGLADDLLNIVDLDLLAADARFRVQEEVGG
ncbi:chemotaxis protein CheW [Ancylobacter mangrovi]|uniref:chemotaxis protein CheW n=1 Tax=Ancylobacter mangrovi TaxID=2972472 RepID=UPI002163D9CF|nr:chemotaxis protein CheW [Ancylobacter mangrovi]MCS0502266.1 chemotaxis protein CheW [Ancylobacter mangrovi]